MRVLKILCSILLLVVVLAGGGLYWATGNLPSLVQALVKEQGSKATGTSVTLSDVSFNFASGKVSLAGLSVANPEGYSKTAAFNLSKVVFHLDLPSLLEDAIIIKEFAIEGAVVSAEQVNHSLKTNLQVIADNAKAASAGQKKQPAASKPEKEKQDPATSPKLIVEKFRFVQSAMHLRSERWGDRDLVIPDLILKDIGKSQGGLTPEALTTEITRLITEQANAAIKEELKTLAEEEAKKKIGGKIKNKLNEWFGK